MIEPSLSPKQKALKVNLMPDAYGTFAEIGAGQEVVRYFFRAGGASGTVAKTISAYDMVMSDSIYGQQTKRYVSRPRLEKMLSYEFDLLVDRLSDVKKQTRFFAFADTVSALNYRRDNDPHGWIGIRFQHQLKAAPSDIIIHTRMHDNHNVHQQQAIGVLGTNMIYGALQFSDDPYKLLHTLMDNLEPNRIEIDMVQFSGPAFKAVDNRLLNLQLVKWGWTNAVMFNETGAIVVPTQELYKKNIMVVRGSYRPPTLVNVDILKKGFLSFSRDIGSKDIVTLCEITMKQLGEDGEIADEDFLARVDLLAAMNYNVLISNFPQYYHLTHYFSQFKRQCMAIVLGAYNFSQIFSNDYSEYDGGLLSAFGRLFQNNLYVYTYPYKEEKNAEIVCLKNLPISKQAQPLLDYLQENCNLKDIENFDDSILHIYSRSVLNKIINNEQGWEKLVPKNVAKTINDQCLFGHPCFHKKKKSNTICD